MSARSGDLCRTCERLDFRKLLFSGIRADIPLGRWEHVLKSSRACPFCSLVVASLHKAAQTELDLSLDDTVYLRNIKCWEASVSNLEYYGPSSSKYSNWYNLKSAAKHQAETSIEPYRLVVKYTGCNDAKWHGQIQHLHKPHKKRQFRGRHVRHEQADIPLINTWLKICDNIHGKSCEDPGKASARIGRIRVIDVDRMVVIAAPPNCRYFALSYVWGGKQRFVARKKLFELSPIGLEYLELPSQLPQTIIDACTVTRALGERYLWVDSLCIIQDNDEDRHDQVLRMDAIYSSAALTIAAGSGAHSDSGLPGISVPRKVSQYRTEIDGLTLAIPFPTLSELESGNNLLWNTRGWTFQEKVMSKRLLMFTDYQVYFRCSEMVWCEDVVIESTQMSRHYRKKLQPLRWAADRTLKPQLSTSEKIFNVLEDVTSTAGLQVDESLLNYTSVIQEFTQRTLSNPKDSVNAVIGILRTLNTIGPFYHGIPNQFIDAALLWHVENGASLTRKSSFLFPSWSWAAWNMPTGCRWLLGDLLDTYSMGILQMHQGKTYPKFLLTESGLEKTARTTSSSAPEPPKISTACKNLLHHLGCFVYLETYILRFSFGPRIDSRNSIHAKDETSYLCYQLQDKRGLCIGEIWMPRATREHYDGQRADFIVLSQGLSLIGAEPALEYIPHVKEKRGMEPVHTVNVPVPRKKWAVLNVMLVAWAFDDKKVRVAQRVAIGKVIAGAVRFWGKKQWVMLA